MGTVAASPSSGTAPRPAMAAEPRRPRILLGVLAGLGLGLGPRPTAELRGDLGLRWPSARLVVFGRHAFAQSSGRADRPGVRVAIAGGGVLGCWAPGRGRFDFPVCTGLELAAVIARASGTAVASQRVAQTMVAVPIEIGVGFAPVPAVAVRASVGSSLSVRRPAAHIRGDGGPFTTVRTGAAGLHAAIGAELRF